MMGILEDSEKLDKILEMSIKHGEEIAKMEQHLSGINGFVKDQCKINSYCLKRINMGEGAIKLAIVGASVWAFFGIILPAISGG